MAFTAYGYNFGHFRTNGNINKLLSPDFFYGYLFKFDNVYAKRLNFLAVLRLSLNPIKNLQ